MCTAMTSSFEVPHKLVLYAISVWRLRECVWVLDFCFDRLRKRREEKEKKRSNTRWRARTAMKTQHLFVFVSFFLCASVFSWHDFCVAYCKCECCAVVWQYASCALCVFFLSLSPFYVELNMKLSDWFSIDSINFMHNIVAADTAAAAVIPPFVRRHPCRSSLVNGMFARNWIHCFVWMQQKMNLAINCLRKLAQRVSVCVCSTAAAAADSEHCFLMHR